MDTVTVPGHGGSHPGGTVRDRGIVGDPQVHVFYLSQFGPTPNLPYGGPF